MGMIKISKIRKFHYLTYPAITPIITSGTLDKPDAMAASWVSPLSVDPPLFGVAVSPRRYTYELIKKYGEFGVCFLPFGMVDIILKVGSVSGRAVNKFEEFGIKIKRPEKIGAPLIEGSLSALECKVVKECDVGDHTFFIGEVVVA
ncbi:MAG: flavin reductase family protein, partial [Candidatus Njordarchaeota archaeon]